MAAPVPLSKPPRLFISCSHDSRAHEDRILALANRLRKDGFDPRIDQFDPPPPDEVTVVAFEPELGGRYAAFRPRHRAGMR
jgi:hypothetical protein